MSITRLATFNSARTELLRKGCPDGWFDPQPEPKDEEVFFEHGFHLPNRRLWLNEETREFVVTDEENNVLPPEFQEKEEAQKYWAFLDEIMK